MKEETQKMSNQMTPFARYRQGYIDAFAGNSTPSLLNDTEYKTGFEEGKTDDALGIEPRYVPDAKVAPTPLPAAVALR